MNTHKKQVIISQDYVLKIVYLTPRKHKTLLQLQDLSSPLNHHLLPLTFCENEKRKKHFLPCVYITLRMNKYTTLKEYLSLHDFSLHKLCTLAMDLCEAVFYLHEHRLLHMDINPNNIYVTDYQHYLLGDLDDSIYISPKKDFIKMHQVYTTIFYASPELFKSGTASPKSDVYALGKTLYSLLPSALQKKNYPHKKSPPSSADYPTEKLTSLIYFMCSSDVADRPDDLLKLKSDFEVLKDKLNDQAYTPRLTTCAGFGEQTTRTTRIYSTISQKTNILTTGFFLILILFFVSKNFCSTVSVSQTSTFPNASSTVSVMQKNTSFHPYSTVSLLPKTVSTCKPFSITNLEMEDKKIMDLSELKNLSTLRRLYLSNNKIMDLSPLHNLNLLKELYLNSNLITNLRPLQTMQNLEILLLQDNNIENISPLSSLTSLRHLDISDNPGITEIQDLSNLSQLEFLNIIGTNVSKKQQLLLQQKLPDCLILR